MSVSQTITKNIQGFPVGEPFSTNQFLRLGSRAAIDKSLSRLVKQALIERITPGVYVRPKKNRFIGSVKPEINSVVRVIAAANGENIQAHGAEAARRFQLSTQVPTFPIYYTSGSSRTLSIGELKVKFIHAAPRKLQYAGENAGLALSALWFLGKHGLTASAVEKVMRKLSSSDQQKLLTADKPAWMNSAFTNAYKEYAVV